MPRLGGLELGGFAILPVIASCTHASSQTIIMAPWAYKGLGAH
jgi:hypothetical protein